MSGRRWATRLAPAGFGLLATLLASVGLYGAMAFAVARRTKELGARPGAVLWLAMREVAVLPGIGLAVGVPAAGVIPARRASRIDPMLALRFE